MSHFCVFVFVFAGFALIINGLLTTSVFGSESYGEISPFPLKIV